MFRKFFYQQVYGRIAGRADQHLLFIANGLPDGLHQRSCLSRSWWPIEQQTALHVSTQGTEALRVRGESKRLPLDALGRGELGGVV